MPFSSKAPSLKKIFNSEIKIYATPDEYFTTKFREIFKKTKLRHTSAAESKQWLGGPKMRYWEQQLNFAVFCATQGCGVPREIFDSGLTIPPQIRSFYIFHVYFTVRRILYQLGGIQSISALPGHPTFNQFITIMTCLHMKSCVMSLELTLRVISASFMAQTTAWGASTCGAQTSDR